MLHSCVHSSPHGYHVVDEHTPLGPQSASSNHPTLRLKRRNSMQNIIRAGEKEPWIVGMSYNSARDELFFVDRRNHAVRVMRLRQNPIDLRDIYKAPHDKLPDVYTVCHMRDTDTLLVSSWEDGADGVDGSWLVALARNGPVWRETHRVQIEKPAYTCSVLSDSQVLVGQWYSTDLELYRVESGRIVYVNRIHLPEQYKWFTATSSTDTCVALFYDDDTVRVHRLHENKLDELARMDAHAPRLVWLDGRLTVNEYDADMSSDAVIQLDVKGKELERRHELIASSSGLRVGSWCPVDNGLAIFDYDSFEVLHYSFN